MRVYIAVLLMNFIKLALLILQFTFSISNFLLLILIFFYSILVIAVGRVNSRLCLVQLGLSG